MRVIGFVLIGIGALLAVFGRPKARALSVPLTPERLYGFAMHDKELESLYG